MCATDLTSSSKKEREAQYMATLGYPQHVNSIPRDDFIRLLRLEPPAHRGGMLTECYEPVLMRFLTKIADFRFGKDLGRYHGQHRRFFW